MKNPHVDLYIEGKWRPAGFRKSMPVLNPATEEPIGRVAHADLADLDEALESAAKGFKVWRKSPRMSARRRCAKQPNCCENGSTISQP